MRASKAMNYVPLDMLPLYPVRAWLEQRTLPEWRGGQFRRWWRTRAAGHGAITDGGGGDDG
jgi:hypothetical protein